MCLWKEAFISTAAAAVSYISSVLQEVCKVLLPPPARSTHASPEPTLLHTLHTQTIKHTPFRNSRLNGLPPPPCTHLLRFFVAVNTQQNDIMRAVALERRRHVAAVAGWNHSVAQIVAAAAARHATVGLRLRVEVVVTCHGPHPTPSSGSGR